MKTVLVPLADGFEDIEAVATIDVLRRGGVQVTTASLGPEKSALSAHGIKMECDAALPDVIDAPWDAIVLPGGGEGTANLMACEPLVERLRRQKFQNGAFVCAICAAPTVLAAAGLIEGEHVTCYPSCAGDMGVPVVDVPAVADGLVITGQAPGAAVTFAFAVLENLMGPDAVREVSEGMVAEI